MWVLGGKCPPPTYTINTALHYIKYDANELINSICSLFVWLHVFTGYWNSFFNPSLSEFIWDFECSRCSLLLQTLLAVYSFTVAHCLIGLDFEWRAFRLQKQRPFSWGGGITASQTGRQIPDQFINLLQNKLLSMDGSHELNQSKFHFLTFMLLFKCDNVHLFSMSSFYGFTALSGQ